VIVVARCGCGPGRALGEVGWESLRRRRRPWLVAGIVVAAFALIAALSLLGLELPRE
jgi:hypothetical protein